MYKSHQTVVHRTFIFLQMMKAIKSDHNEQKHHEH